ncbi:hypothetical protein M9458_007851 [Cirrhinus mrigala]|uniref:Tc1-like transposase DDE domain-containing protein n=1 Tax=Cirrhinus mrigala TaxID=683832 RepID=A0ABD0RLW5_CIRMR
MLEIIVLPLLTMVTYKETRAAIIALHKNGFTGKDIVATKIAPKSTIYRIIKNFKERGRPRKNGSRQVEAKTFGRWPGVKKGSKEATSLQKKNIRDRSSAKSMANGLLRTGAKSYSFRLFGASGKRLVRRKKGERYHQSCVMPTVKHPETIHVWGCFSSKGVGSLTIVPKNTAMNKEWYQNTLQQQLLPTIQQQFGEEQCIFQHDGAPCHNAKVITKWLGDQNIDILGPWPGNSPDLNPIENLWSILKRRVDKQKPTNSDKLQEVIMKEWVAVSQDLAQKLIESMPSRITEVLKKKGQHCKY